MRPVTRAYLRNSDDKTNLPDLALLHDLRLTVIFDLAAMIFANPYTKVAPSHHFFAGLCARLRYRLPDHRLSKLRHAISSLDCALILRHRVLDHELSLHCHAISLPDYALRLHRHATTLLASFSVSSSQD